MRHLGLSEASPATLERARRSTRSPRCRPSTRCSTASPSARSCRRAGGSASASSRYSPLGRGLLGGAIRKAGDLTADDWRLQSPRYQGDNLAHNVALVEKVEAFARAKGCTLGAAGPRLGARAGQGHRPDPRHEAHQVPGAEPGRAGHRADAGRPGGARRRDAGRLGRGRRSLPAGDDGLPERLTQRAP